MRRGDWVEVRQPAQIMATLDASGALDELPFMPEMAAYCGRRFQVDRRAEKICDTMKYTGSRRLPNAVLLSDLRCDGASHGGCQAECRYFWKEAWLRKVDPNQAAEEPVDSSALQALIDFSTRFVRRTVDIEGKSEERWHCQAMSLLKATSHVPMWDPRPYIGEYTNGNVSLGHCIRICARAATEEPLRKLGLIPEVYLRGTASKASAQRLDLKPGEWVQVLSEAEIAGTLTPDGYNRGLWFDREMAAYCGGTYRVRSRVSRFIDDYRNPGQLVDLKSDAIILENVVCSGELSPARWFCPRRIFPYWRECWLRRVEAPAAPG
jgi:hypothetical protein